MNTLLLAAKTIGPEVLGIAVALGLSRLMWGKKHW